MCGSSHEKFCVWLRREVVFVLFIQITLPFKILYNPRVKRKLALFYAFSTQKRRPTLHIQFSREITLYITWHNLIRLCNPCVQKTMHCSYYSFSHIQLQQAASTAEDYSWNGIYLCMKKNILIVLSSMASFKCPASQASNIIFIDHIWQILERSFPKE